MSRQAIAPRTGSPSVDDSSYEATDPVPRMPAERGRWRWCSVIMLAGLLSTGAVSTTRACELEIVRSDIGGLDRQGGYDVFDLRGVAGRARVDIRRRDQPAATTPPAELDGDSMPTMAAPTPAEVPCVGELRILGSGVLEGMGSRIAYTLESDDSRAVASGGALRFRALAMMPGERRSLEFNLSIPHGQYVPAGRYAGQLELQLVQNAGSDAAADYTLPGEEDDRRNLPVSLSVQPTARVFIAGTQSQYRLVSFGELETGKRPQLPVTLTVQSTSKYRLSFRSRNSGELVRTGSVSPTSRIPYSLSIAGEPVPLTNSAHVVTRRAGGSGQGEQLPLDLIILDASDKQAGRYTDRLTIEISPSVDSP